MDDDRRAIRMHGMAAGEVLEDEAGACIEVPLSAVVGAGNAVLMLDAGLVEPGELVDVTIDRGAARGAVHRPHAEPRWVGRR